MRIVLSKVPEIILKKKSMYDKIFLTISKRYRHFGICRIRKEENETGPETERKGTDEAYRKFWLYRL